MFDYEVGLRLVVTKNQLGFVVYDDKTRNSLDVFPDTKEGFELLMEFLSKTLKTQ